MIRWLLISAALLQAPSSSAQIADPVDTLARPFRILTIEDGLSQGMVNAIMQDRFGFIWLATKDGLNRHDGYDFKVYRNVAGDTGSLAGNYITALAEGPDGSLWVGTASSGLDRMDRRTERFQHIDLGEEGNGAYVLGMTSDDHGAMWIATNRGLFKVNNADLQAGTPTVRRYFSRQCRVTKDRLGNLWVYQFATGSYRISPSHGEADHIDTLDMAPLRNGPWNEDPNTHVNGLFAVDHEAGRVFAIHPYFIAEYDPATLEPRIIHRVAYPGGGRLETDAAAMDRRGVLWIGSVDLWRFDTRTRQMAMVLPREQGMRQALHDVAVTYLDANGLLWVGTRGYGVLTHDPRIDRFNAQLDGSVYWMQEAGKGRMICLRPGTFLRVLDQEAGRYVIDLKDSDPALRGQFDGLMPDTHAAIRDKDGTFWMSKGALVHFDPVTRQVTHHPLKDNDGRPMKRRKGFFPLITDGEHHLWFGTDSSFCRFDKRTGAYRHHRYPIEPVHLPYFFAQAAHIDSTGMIWIGTVKGLLRLDPRTSDWTHHQHRPDDTTSLSFDLIFSLLPDPEQPHRFLWIGTNGGGLNRFDMGTGESQHYRMKDGLPNDVIYGILPDGGGRLWMSTNKGICRFDPRTGEVRNYDASDGLQSDEFNRNAFCSLDDGMLFFGGVQGFNRFHPSALDGDAPAPVVRLTGIKLINEQVPFGGDGDLLAAPAFMSQRMRIPPGANMVTFEFANMEFSDPRQHRYQYRLEGFDPEWIMAGRNNTAIYTNLDPGEYTFHVRGENRDGVWSEAGTSFDLTVLPPWWRTPWAYAIYVLVLGGGLLGFIWMQRYRRKMLERTVMVRTQELIREKDRSDELLKNILPAGIAAELKRMGRAEARAYERVTVLFSDFAGFTGISEQLSPAELVEELNVCFNAFDRIMDKYGIEKIKTIGDAYMAAGGVPDPSGGTALAVVRAALEMQEVMAERRTERKAIGRPAFQMRVGIHTGPVVAGIVGRRKFQYDIWGDTVNVASRMESSGEVGMVNISEATYVLINKETGLTFTARGKVKVKGKGELEMYFVQLQEERVPLIDPVANDEGEIPNAWRLHKMPASGSTDEQEPGLKRSKPLPSNLRILLAEDNSFNVMVAQDELQDALEGVVIDVASNGREALDLMKGRHYDLVLMDVQMPVMDGYDATRAIRALPGTRSKVPVIALTANVMQAEVDRCMEAGMDAFVPKPFKREELIGAIRTVLNV